MKTITPKILDAINADQLKHGLEPVKTSEDIYEALSESKEVHVEDCGDRRWWKDTFTVVDLNGVLIGFGSAETTGDDSPHDKGWEFDIDTVCEVKAVTKTVEVTTYEPVTP